jgi:hypothetical protein
LCGRQVAAGHGPHWRRSKCAGGGGKVPSLVGWELHEQEVVAERVAQEAGSSGSGLIGGELVGMRRWQSESRR